MMMMMMEMMEMMERIEERDRTGPQREIGIGDTNWRRDRARCCRACGTFPRSYIRPRRDRDRNAGRGLHSPSYRSLFRKPPMERFPFSSSSTEDRHTHRVRGMGFWPACLRDDRRWAEYKGMVGSTRHAHTHSLDVRGVVRGARSSR